MNFNKLTIEEKFGQMLIMGLDTYEINDEIINIIKEYKIGGVILYKKNYTSLDSMVEVINKLKRANKDNKIPLFIGIDQENGVVNRFPKDILNIYGAKKQSEAQDVNITRAVGEITTYILKEVGVNMNFSPVLDINRYEKDSLIGKRCYGKSKDEIIRNTIPLMHFMQKNKVISVVKHFPGHGITNKDSHILIPKTKDLNKLENEDLEIFQEAINSGAEAIMIDHLRIKGFGNKPATLNKKILDTYLFNKLNYKGLVISDDLRMGFMGYFSKTKNNVCKSIKAGNDLIMIKYRKNDFKKLYKSLFKMVKYCEIDPETINNSAKKIVLLKNKYEISDKELNPKFDLDKINDKIKKINTIIDKKRGEIYEN